MSDRKQELTEVTEQILSKLVDISEYEAFYIKMKAQELDRHQSKKVLEKLIHEMDYLQTFIEKYMDAWDNKEIKLLRTPYMRRRVYVVRTIKQIAFRWWEERDQHEKPAKRPWKPRFLKDEIAELVGDHITEAQLTNTLWLIRTAYARKRTRVDSDFVVRQLVKNDENGQLEVKKSLSLHEAIGKTISAFANTSGGKIIIGLSETDKIDTEDAYRITDRFAVSGLEGDLDANRIRLTMNLGGKLTIPIERIKFDIETIKKKTIMIISVPPYRNKTQELIFYNEEAYFREDNHNRKFSTMEVFQIAKSYWSSLEAIDHDDDDDDK